MSGPTRSSLRRSRRATKKSSSDYNVGDIVEISRGGGSNSSTAPVVVKARLAQLLTETSSPNPRWLITVDNKAEEVYEHTFGRVIQYAASPTNMEDDGSEMPPVDATGVSAMEANVPPTAAGPEGSTTGLTADANATDPSSSLQMEGGVAASSDMAMGKADSSPSRPRRNSPKTNDMSNTNSSSSNSSPRADGGGEGDAAAAAAASSGNEGKKKNVTFSNDDSSGLSDGVSSSGFESGGKSSKVSAREQRSRRRQAMIDEFGPAAAAALSLGGSSTNGNSNGNGNGTNTSGGGRVRSSNNKRNRSGSGGRNNKSKRSRGRDERTNSNGERCVNKVKLLTGTLYIYRGPAKQARAEFVRRL